MSIDYEALERQSYPKPYKGEEKRSLISRRIRQEPYATYIGERSIDRRQLIRTWQEKP